MNAPDTTRNRRILVIDDNPAIHDDFRKILAVPEQTTEFDQLSEALFGQETNKPVNAGFLAEVMKRYPRTVRLVLSGHADRELVLKRIGSTHQFLSTPCQPDELKAAIARAADLEQSLRDQNLRQLVSRMERLPSMPSLYGQIVDQLQDPEIGLEAIGEIVGQDMAMTAKILKLVNSAFFGLGRQLSSPTEAVLYLGLDTIKSLVLSIHAFSQFGGAKGRLPDFRCATMALLLACSL